MDASCHQLDDAKARARHLLTCPLCTKEYDDPRVLPCQHTFCCRCLAAHVDRMLSSRPATSSTRRGAFSCPVCLADVGLPAAGARAFPVDQRIRNIRDLVVEEMAKDLASRFRRLHGDGLCNGGGGSAGGLGEEVHGHGGGATRLGKISERPDVNDGSSADGTSARPRRFDNETAYRPDDAQRTPATDDPAAFSRQRPGYSSVRGSKTRRSRTDTPLNDYNDARFETPTFSDSTQTTGETLSSDTDAGFSRNRPAYFSVRERRTRRTRMADSNTQSMYDSISRTTATSSSFGNGHASSQTPESVRKKYQRPSSYVDVPSKSSPFDNINRDDDTSEPYTPKIGRNRFGYSSLRGKCNRPLLDPHKLFDSPADITNEELSSSDGSSRFSNRNSRVAYSHRSQTQDTSDLSESLRRTVSNNQNWTRYTSDDIAHEQKQPENSRECVGDQVRTSSYDDAAKNRTGDYKTRRQRPDSLDTSDLTVLSHLPADIKTSVESQVSEGAPTSTSNHSQSQTQLDHPTEEVGHQAYALESPSTSCALDEVPSVSHTQNDVASQLNDSSRTVDVTNTDSASCSADIGIDNSISKPNNTSLYPPDSSTPASAAMSDVDQTDLLVNTQQCSASEEGIHSPTCSPNESCFSRLTKFRASKNSKQAASSTSSSAADSTSKETESVSPRLHEADTDTIPTAKPHVRKRPPAFVGTVFTYSSSAGSSEEAASTSLTSESVSSNKEHQADEQFEPHPASVGDSTVGNVCSDGVSFDADVKGRLQSMTAVDDEDYHSCSSDVSPTAVTFGAAEFPPGTDTNDVQFSVDNVLTTGPQHDEDSAVYSAAIDSDASLKSATEPCTVPTPTTDDDDVPDHVLTDELVSTTLGDHQGGQTDDISCGLTLLASHPTDGRVADFNVERHQDDTELISEVHVREVVENDDDSGGRSSACSVPDEVHHQNDQQPQLAGDDDRVNEDDVTSNDKTAMEKDGGDGETGCRTSNQPSIDADDVQSAADGYVLATGLAALSDGSLVIADYGARCVCLCDGEGRADHRVSGIKPFSVATAAISGDDDELIYVGDRRRKTLVVLDSHGSDVAQWPDNQFDWICGIACLPDGQLAVLDRSRTRQLGIYAATSGDDGRPLAELGGHGSSLGDLCMAEFIAADSRGRVLVADSANHCVKAFDRRVSSPSVVAVYGTTRGSGDAQLQWPKGVAVDSADNVLVADYRNARVASFSVDGRPLGSVVPAVRGPFAVCSLPTSLSHRRRLAITTYSVSGLSEFRLYDYDVDAIFV